MTLLCHLQIEVTTADVNLILGGFDDGTSGMESIFLNGVCTLGDLIKKISST